MASLSIPKPARVGLMAIAAGAIFFYGVDFLKGKDLFSSSNIYHMRFADVGGLVVGNPVMVNGLTVGKVVDISLEPGPKNQLLVQVEVEKTVPVNTNSKGFLGSTDLLGSKMIGIELGYGGQPLPLGDTLPSYIDQDLMAKIGEKADPIVNRLDSTFLLLNRTLIDFKETQVALNNTLTQFGNAAATTNGVIGENRATLKATAENLKTMTEGLVKTEKQLGEMMANLNQISDTLQRAKIGSLIAQAQGSMTQLNGTLADINAGKGTLGKLAKNDSLYNNLNNATHSLDLLLSDFRLQPKRYVHFSVFGRGEKKK